MKIEPGTPEKKETDNATEETKLEKEPIIQMPEGETTEEVEEHLTTIGGQLPASSEDVLKKVTSENIALTSAVQKQKDELQTVKQLNSSVSTDEIDGKSTKHLVENTDELVVESRRTMLDETVSENDTVEYKSLEQEVKSLERELLSSNRKLEGQARLIQLYHSLNDERFELGKVDTQQFEREVGFRSTEEEVISLKRELLLMKQKLDEQAQLIEVYRSLNDEPFESSKVGSQQFHQEGGYRSLREEVVSLKKELNSTKNKLEGQVQLIQVYHSLNDEYYELGKVDSKRFQQELLKDATADGGPYPKALNADDDTTRHTQKTPNPH